MRKRARPKRSSVRHFACLGEIAERVDQALDEASVIRKSRDSTASIDVERPQRAPRLEDAIRKAGLDPATVDWSSLEIPDGTAAKGAEWRTFWQAVSVDLHIVADGTPQNLKIGLRFESMFIPHWTAAHRDLVEPRGTESRIWRSTTARSMPPKMTLFRGSRLVTR